MRAVLFLEVSPSLPFTITSLSEQGTLGGRLESDRDRTDNSRAVTALPQKTREVLLCCLPPGPPKESASCLCLEETVGSKVEKIHEEKGRNSITDACGERVGKKE